MSGICAIHQPNFFPWLGYFDKMRKADVFVYLDAVDYPKSGSKGMGSWTNRVKVNVQGQPRWVGCSIKRFQGKRLIKDVEISDQQPWREKLLRTLEVNYARSSNYSDVMELLRPLIKMDEIALADFNIQCVEAIRQYLDISGETVRQSEINCEGTATQLLIEVTKAVGCDTYLSGGGASGYQNDELIHRSGLNLLCQDFVPDVYGPANGFLSGLSVIDYLMIRDHK